MNTQTPLLSPSVTDSSYWHHLLREGLPATVVYALAGILLALLAYRLLDLVTPGDLGKKIFDEGNLAVAVLAGFLILGICLIIAAAITG